MKDYIAFFILLLFSCRLPQSDKLYEETNKSRPYKLHLNPSPGSQYHYDISNESELKFEANDRKVENVNKANLGVQYNVSKDSSGDFLFQLHYDKIKLYSKNDNTEIDADADDAPNSIDPVEKMLGVLKEAKITATIDRKGEVKSIAGYKEITSKMMAVLNTTDDNTRNLVQAKWNKIIQSGIVQKNLDQMFKILPDSTIQIDDKWNIRSKETNELNMNVITRYKLANVENGVAHIRSEGEMLNDSTTSNLMGYNVKTDLKGNQEGTFEIDLTTGMLLSSEVRAKIRGTLEVMGNEIPVSLTTTMKVTGRKL